MMRCTSATDVTRMCRNNLFAPPSQIVLHGQHIKRFAEEPTVILEPAFAAAAIITRKRLDGGAVDQDGLYGRVHLMAKRRTNFGESGSRADLFFGERVDHQR